MKSFKEFFYNSTNYIEEDYIISKNNLDLAVYAHINNPNSKELNENYIQALNYYFCNTNKLYEHLKNNPEYIKNHSQILKESLLKQPKLSKSAKEYLKTISEDFDQDVIIVEEYIIENIEINPANKGKLHKYLGIPEDKPIPADKLKAALKSDDPEIRKMANFAKNAKKWKHVSENLFFAPMEILTEEYSKKGFYAEYDHRIYRFNTKIERDGWVKKTYTAKSTTLAAALNNIKQFGGFYDGISHRFINKTLQNIQNTK